MRNDPLMNPINDSLLTFNKCAAYVYHKMISYEKL